MPEERISIHHCSNKCRCLREVKEGYSIVNGLSNGTYCSAYIHGTWQKIDPEKDCKNCKRAEYDGMSRTEAMERMAKALCTRNHGVSYCDFCLCDEDYSCFVCLEREKKNAEAALDALIIDA